MRIRSYVCIFTMMIILGSVQADYKFYEYKDSGACDITQLQGKSLDELKSFCDAAVGCLGFNTEGWIKYSLANPSQWINQYQDPNQGLYVKEYEVNQSPYLKGYTFYQGKDHVLGDLNYLPDHCIYELKIICDSSSDCVGFNTMGWIKKDLGMPSDWSTWSTDPNQGLYVKQPSVSTSSVFGYTLYQLTDSVSGDIIQLKGKSIEELKAFCDGSTGCLGFNTLGYIKYILADPTQWINTIGDSKQDLYVKQYSQCPASNLEGYSFHQGKDMLRGDITYLPGYSVYELKINCDVDSECLGFNTQGWLKKKILPKDQWVTVSTNCGKGFYVKETGNPVSGSLSLRTNQQLIPKVVEASTPKIGQEAKIPSDAVRSLPEDGSRKSDESV